ncbi:MAG: DUF5703 domain-containing protein [Verrucomicrobiota bacterium]|jgi:hypothetical protein
MEIRHLLLAGALFAISLSIRGNQVPAENDVTWTRPGTNENDSMPLGNGDLALNVWTETNGDIVLLAAKSDSWSENGQLLKLGRVRVRLNPNPFAAPRSFTQTLHLETAEVTLASGKNFARIWVDADHPVAHVEIQTAMPVHLEAAGELWRLKEYHLDQQAVQRAGFFELGSDPDGLDFDPDDVLAAHDNRIAWCHFNRRSVYPLVFTREHLEPLLARFPDPLLHRCSGLLLTGGHLVSDGDLRLKSARDGKSFRLDLVALTLPDTSPADWKARMDGTADSSDAISIARARKAHRQWWAGFWNRSRLEVGGTPAAERVSESYTIQRYMTACAGRGAQPIKFNGSLFCVGRDLPAGLGSSESNHDPDFRAWGASYWNQNTRWIYWPLIATGDNDLLAPWYNMYVQALPLAEARVQSYFHHDGAAFIETMYFWGLPNIGDFGWDNPGPELQSEWMRYHVQGGLEVLAQMLDSYDCTQDAAFARGSLLPMANGVITYYDRHWRRDANGKIRLSPAQSIETYQRDAVNPAPDIAGLKSVLPRLLALPAKVVNGTERDQWARLLDDLPALPLGTTAKGKLPPRGAGEKNGSPVLLPAEKYGTPKNSENPELYAVFPYRLYGLGKPDLELARNTFAARLYPFGKCWGQDGVEAALLGLTGKAMDVVQQEFTSYGNERFPWFWSKNNDWIPDMDNGGAGMATLQLMLMQCDGRQIRLLPSWPDEWTADFKLHAPLQTTVEGRVEHGKIIRLKVTPAERAKDVIVSPGRPAGQ